MIKRVLIANRGEIACRISRTCKNLGIEAVAVYSKADEDSRHVREIGHAVELGGAAVSDSYLNIERVINAAISTDCDAIHPGYGFLSENPEFAEAVENAGLIFIGPRANDLRRFGDKSAAKAEAIRAQIPVISGSEGKLSDPDKIADVVRTMMPPIMLKAAAGGGGKGMRVLNDLSNLTADIAAAMSESLRSFSDDALLIEQCIMDARHVEVQIAGDGEGNIIHLFERECSLQRRHQKVVEEAPAIFLTASLRKKLFKDACALGQQIKFRGLGTVEFLVKGDQHYFLEVNPRLQVEHPVTELITGLDLVELQIRIAQGSGLGLSQADIVQQGHAIEVRLYAESPALNFMPATGSIDFIDFPVDDIRVESGVDTGDNVSSYYDPMMAKLISSGNTRQQALERLQQGVDKTVVFGVDNNRHFLKQLLRVKEVEEDRINTGTLDHWLVNYTDVNDNAGSQNNAAIAAALWLDQHRDSSSKNPWKKTGAFTQWGMLSPDDEPIYGFDLADGDVSWEIAIVSVDPSNTITLLVNETRFEVSVKAQGEHSYLAKFKDARYLATALINNKGVHVHSRGQQNSFQVIPRVSDKQVDSLLSKSITAPMMGEVIQVLVNEGDSVKAGQLLIVMESMKMQLQIEAIHDGVVSELYCQIGNNVAKSAVLVDVDAQ